MVWGLRITTGLVARICLAGLKQLLKFSLTIGIGDFFVGGLVGNGVLVEGDLEGEVNAVHNIEITLINPELIKLFCVRARMEIF